MTRDIELQSQIETAAKEAYDYVAWFKYKDLNPSEVYRRPQCRMVTAFIIDVLREAGLDVEMVSRGGEHIEEHRYLKWGSKIIDATWQQFIPESDADDLPKVYVGPRAGLQDLAELHGAEPWVIRLWDEDGPPRVLTVQERVATAYDASMS
jgi:hypothetical protein